MKKRLLSILLATATMLSLMGTTVNAAGNGIFGLVHYPCFPTALSRRYL